MTPPTLQITLRNQTSSSNVFAYITGLDLTANNAWFLLESDGQTPYHPTSPTTLLQPLTKDCSIPLGPPGSSRVATIPHLAGGRIWFSVDNPLVFLLNPGPALVEPSATNATDPNYHTTWHFCEFTFNEAQLFVNVSCVDFVCLPIALTVRNAQGGTQRVEGHGSDVLARVAGELEAQHQRDGAGWDRLIVRMEDGGGLLRVLSPNNGLVLDPTLFTEYWSGYVDTVWEKYRGMPLTINTQAAAGHVQGRVNGDMLEFPATSSSFGKPSARDIFGCSSGPFSTAGAGPDTLAVIPRLAAALNRSTIHSHDFQPHGDAVDAYYGHEVTNHYARIVHAVSLDGRGYAFPYDDVVPDGGSDVAGTMFDGEPVSLEVTVGGTDVHR